MQHPSTSSDLIAGELTQASDSKVLKIVSLVDALGDRQAVDAMIAPLRPRLKTLRPRRPLTAKRLMFAPFDAAIVPDSSWAPAMGLIPRSLLHPIYCRLRPRIADLGAIEAEIKRLDHLDRDGCARLGHRLWSAGAMHLSKLSPEGDDWAATGLDRGQRQGVLSSMQLVLEQNCAVRALPDLVTPSGAPAGSKEGVAPRTSRLHDPLIDILQAASFCSLDAWGLMLNLLLDPLSGVAAGAGGPFVGIVLDCAVEVSQDRPEPRIRSLLRAGVDRAIGRMFDTIGIIPGDADDPLPSEGAWMVERMTRLGGLLDELSHSQVLSPGHQQRLSHLHQTIVSIVRRRVDRTMDGSMLRAMAGLVEGGLATGEVEALERQARTLRGLSARLRDLDTVMPGVPPGAQADAVSGQGSVPVDWGARIGELVALQSTGAAARRPVSPAMPYAPPAIDPNAVRLLRLGEILLGSSAALALAMEAGWSVEERIGA